MTHSLNDENGISSACEYDINSVIGKVIMTNLSGKAPYMGNTNAIVFDKEGHMIPFHKFNDNTIEDIADKTSVTDAAAANNFFLIFFLALSNLCDIWLYTFSVPIVSKKGNLIRLSGRFFG